MITEAHAAQVIMSEEPESDLQRRLRESGLGDLERLVDELGERLDRVGALALLRNPHVSTELIDAVARRPDLVARYELQREIAAHPRSARTVALRFVSLLYWHDLATLAIDTRLHPLVRRSADRRLLERLPALAIGEKSALARRASRAVVERLRFDPSPRVVAALLENPRLTEGDLVPLATFERANPRCLEVLARDLRWSHRLPVRVALCRNPATPLSCGLALLTGLPRRELATIAHDPRVASAIRRQATALGGEAGRRPGRSPFV